MALGGPWLLAQGGAQTKAPLWVNERLREWTVNHYDQTGQSHWTGKKWLQSPSEDQRAEAFSRLGNPRDRRLALWALTAWPMEQWAPMALQTGGAEAAQFLYQRGYRQAGQDPMGYLGSQDELDRPWTHGLGLHLDKATWRFQWIPSPALFTQTCRH